MTGRAALVDRLRRGILAACWVPPAVLAHEAGHWIGYVLAGLPEPTIQYASSGFRDQPAFWNAVRAGDMALAETMGSVTGAGIAAFLGIAVSWGLMLGGAWLVRRPRVRIAAAAVVLASAVRFVPVGLFLVRGVAQHTDEAHVAQAMGLPGLLPVLILFGILLAALSIRTVARTIPVGDRRALLSDLVLGVIAGTVAWMGVVGPAILP
ncbi:MAG: hypothetical protein SFU84_07330 [Gemmatimonadales bacterium]|nr:hypothetical protein [Gemmatimonadales bacterium]